MLRPEQGPVIKGLGWPAQGSVGDRWRGQTRRVARHLLLGTRRSGVLHGVRLHQVRAGRPDAGADPPAQSGGAGGIQMKDAAFQELLTSVRQAGQIRRGTRRPSRTTTFHPTDVQAVRAKTRRIPGGIRADDRRQRRDAAELGAGPAHTGWPGVGAAPSRGTKSEGGHPGPAHGAETRGGITSRCTRRPLVRSRAAAGERDRWPDESRTDEIRTDDVE